MKSLTNMLPHFIFAVALFAVAGNCVEVLNGDEDLANYFTEAMANYTTWLQDNELDPSPPITSVMIGFNNGVQIDCVLGNHTMRGHSKTINYYAEALSSFWGHVLFVDRQARNENDSLVEFNGNVVCTGVVQAGEHFPDLSTDIPFSVQGNFNATINTYFDFITMRNVGVTLDYKLDITHSWAEYLFDVGGARTSFLLTGQFNDTLIDDGYFGDVQKAFENIYFGYSTAPFPAALLYEQFVREIAAKADLKEIIENVGDWPNPYVPTPTTTSTTTSTVG